jgi:uracil phosphoribosyltransferase
MTETAYLAPAGRLEHHYGPRVHLLTDVWSMSLTAWLSHPDVRAPRFHRLLEACFRRLLEAAAEQLPTEQVRLPTRMTAQHPDAAFAGRVISPTARIVIVDIARGGIVPSYVFQQQLLDLVEPDAVRIDHLYMQRVADVSGHIIGVNTSGSKLGGPVAGATVLIPDPMAATGSSLDDAVRTYKALPGGPPARIVACHLIVTPEYLKRITTTHPDVEIYALRVDRGLSSPEVLATVPGTRWDEERGLNDHDYIVPGAGGLGELINNAFV